MLRIATYRYCATYPKQNVVPFAFNDESLRKAGAFRCLSRFPSVVWRHKVSGTVLLRSSQPYVGLFYQRNQEDEDLIQVLLLEYCYCYCTTTMQVPPVMPFYWFYWKLLTACVTLCTELVFKFLSPTCLHRRRLRDLAWSIRYYQIL